MSTIKSSNEHLTLNADGSSKDIKLQANGGDKVTVKSDGKVGIGETVPLGYLHVKNGDSGQGSVNAAGDSLVLESNGSTGITFLSGSSSNTSLIMGDSESNYQGVIIYDHSANAFKFATTGTERMRIDSSGNVGIGQTSPSSANSIPTFLHIGNSSTTQSAIVLEDDENKWEIINNGDIAFRNGTTAYFRVGTTNIQNQTGIYSTTPTTATTTGWNFNSGDATVTCTQNTAVKIGDCGASGMLIINDTTLNGQINILLTGAGAFTFLGASSHWVNSSSPGTNQVGFYRSGNQIYVKNGKSSTVQLGLLTFRTRNAQ